MRRLGIVRLLGHQLRERYGNQFRSLTEQVDSGLKESMMAVRSERDSSSIQFSARGLRNSLACSGPTLSPELSFCGGFKRSGAATPGERSSSFSLCRRTPLVSSFISQRKAFHCEQRCWMSSGAKDYDDTETISVTFVDKDGEETQITVPIGMSMLEAAHENDIELEGACEGSLACSTCHVIFMDEDLYSKLPEPTDEENDMLDLAFGLTETSRLGCQVIASKELDGMRLALPAATRNFAVDGHVPKPH